MEGQVDEEQRSKPRVIKVDSLETWESKIIQATNDGCPIVAHFTASWCMPSVAMNPIVEELAANYPVVLFLTVDVDEVKEVATRMDVKAMPTFLLMKDGVQIDKLVGANPEEIKKRIEAYVQSIGEDVAISAI